ncbi:hypothetical protein [Kitasatospora sp. NBC_00315]|uniref:hypothetical protein n=1 Tax=Kitasatospora sp. NBC_00315 TaxID=2975963 RepID=UPI0032461281
MPGSVTISHHGTAVPIDAADAQRLASGLDELAYLLEIPGPNRLSDAQLGVLCDGKPYQRDAVVRWTRKLAAELRGGA